MLSAPAKLPRASGRLTEGIGPLILLMDNSSGNLGQARAILFQHLVINQYSTAAVVFVVLYVLW